MGEPGCCRARERVGPEPLGLLRRERVARASSCSRQRPGAGTALPGAGRGSGGGDAGAVPTSRPGPHRRRGCARRRMGKTEPEQWLWGHPAVPVPPAPTSSRFPPLQQLSPSSPLDRRPAKPAFACHIKPARGPKLSPLENLLNMGMQGTMEAEGKCSGVTSNQTLWKNITI